MRRHRIRFCQFVTSCCANFFGAFVTETTFSKIRCTRGLANILSFCTKKRLAVNGDEKEIVELARSFVDLIDDEHNDNAEADADVFEDDDDVSVFDVFIDEPERYGNAVSF